MDKRILLTGGSGFIGQKLINKLITNGYEVHAIVHSTSIPKQDGLILHLTDLFNTHEISKLLQENKFENLIHLAWYVGKHCHTDNSNLDWSIATLNLTRLFIENGGKHFIGAGSISEYNYRYGYFIEDETPINTKTLYGNCKNAMYRILQLYCTQNNCEFKWLRIFNLYGENEKPQRLMPSVINACLKNEVIRVSDCEKYQDYLYIEDTVDGILKVFEGDVNGAINICSGNPVKLKSIVDKIVHLTNFQGKILWGSIPTAFDEPLTIGNNDKLKSLGWEQKYSLEEGLKLTINWWKQQQKEIINV